ncbi:glycoside hydrolase family 3 N-terminal domain-containing protein [Draconibacterium sp. IB214405]|uniref:glycoside hydrolase family 3 N-terminal domain-containing protein n=1 Tax=Draconibacterium sp. IB214405 TaxID=3097352 RepID=UPI002A112400|nr:glycoside hydrolase family 3 N-terminal domain-containing protein [Draconibacterium sp. IB214405]MDX8339348.1 glycoside hydrolase family 3 N-terminal domain-containing protein [Draconibacterium sp. IB214405]
MNLFQNFSSSAKSLFIPVLSTIIFTMLSGCNKTEEYPRNPDPLGSGKVKWSESQTPDGWTKVNNEEGATLGYSKSSALHLIQVDGYAFKDLNRNGLLDKFEDWRLDFNTRAAAMVDEFSAEQMMGMKMNPFGGWKVNADSLDAIIMESLDFGYRQLRAPRGGADDTRTKVNWNNMVQEYIESLGNMTCLPAVWIDDPRSGDVTSWPSNLGLAATFDPEIGAQYGRMMSEEWRAMGISMQVATQMDLATEPRWKRIPGTFGEDPALSMDVAQGVINGWQSTYDEEGNDLGWGKHSVNNQMKHFSGDGAAEGGRESHTRDGAYNVFPGGQFFTHTLPFLACMDLPGKTKTVSAAMTNYSIGIEADGSPVGGERLATSYSNYKLNHLLRDRYNWDGYILTDFGVLTSKNYGVEDLTPVEKRLSLLKAGCDAFGGEGGDIQESIDLAMKAYELGVSKLGQSEMDEIMKKSTERILRTHFNIGIVDNPYLDYEVAESTALKPEHKAAGHQAHLKSIVMLKNSTGMIHEATSGGQKPKVYIPRVFVPAAGGWSRTPASAEPGFNLKEAGIYYEVLTDALSEKLSGPADRDGNPTLSAGDIIRASEDKIAECDFAIVRINNPKNGNPTFMESGGMQDGPGSESSITDRKDYTYLPISLQYRPYTANSEFVRRESLGGDMIEVTENGTTKMVKENRSYFGRTGIITNEPHLDLVLNTAAAAKKTIVVLDVSNPMVFTEFENEVDAILVGFGGNRAANVPDNAFLEIISGQVEPSGLLPLQMPANMETVEAQFEDVPRDMECHIDSEGNTYDFAFGLNWSGVIEDERTAKYNVPAIVGQAPE